jgi:hypothetical protein
LIIINYSKPTSGANALTNSPFLVIDDNQLRLTKIERIEAFEFQKFKLSSPLMYALDLEFQLLIQIKMTYIKSKLPLNFAICGVPKSV